MTPATTTTTTTAAFDPDEETADLQREEVQALEAIFENAFELRSSRSQEEDDDDDKQTFGFPIVYRIQLNDIDTGDGTSGNSDCSYDGTKNWPKHPLAIEVRYPKNYPWDDNDDDNDQEQRDATATATTDPSFRLLHENSVVEFPSSVSEALLAVLADTAENERGMPCVLSCLYAVLEYLGRDREWRDGSNSNNNKQTKDDIDGSFAPDCAISDTATTTTTHYACISTHHLLDHKPDNLLKTGHKCQLVGFYKFGTPGIAIAWGHKDSIEEFLDTLKRAMPQKKFELVFSRVWGDDDSNKPIPTGWESVDPPTLKQELDKIGVPEEDYYTALGIEKRDPPKGKGKTKSK